MLLEIEVFYLPDDYDEDSYETLGKKIQMEVGRMVINTNLLVAFNENTETKNAMLRMSNGENFEANIPYESFKNIIFECEAQKDIYTCNGN